jgi:hypothetical protein
MARNQKPADEGTRAPKRPRRASPNGNGASDEEIARRAYEIYQGRGGTDGADLDDWLEAERQLRSTDVTAQNPRPRRRSKETTAA